MPTFEGYIRKEETSHAKGKVCARKLMMPNGCVFYCHYHAHTHHFGWDITRLQTTTAVIFSCQNRQLSEAAGFPRVRNVTPIINDNMQNSPRDPYTQRNVVRIYHLGGDIDELKIHSRKIQFGLFCMINEFLLKKQPLKYVGSRIGKEKINRNTRDLFLQESCKPLLFVADFSLFTH